MKLACFLTSSVPKLDALVSNILNNRVHDYTAETGGELSSMSSSHIMLSSLGYVFRFKQFYTTQSNLPKNLLSFFRSKFFQSQFLSVFWFRNTLYICKGSSAKPCITLISLFYIYAYILIKCRVNVGYLFYNLI